MESSECQLHSLISGVKSNSTFLGTNICSTLKKEEDTSKANDYIAESLSKRCCNGVIGVPVTFLDKWSLRQFVIKGIDRYVEDNTNHGKRFTIKNNEIYARILILRKL